MPRQGWDNPAGDEFFRKQRENADKCTKSMALVFYRTMRRIGEELNQVSNAFALGRKRAEILDLCMAPGGFLETAVRHNPGSSAVAFSLPVSDGGHAVLLPRDIKNVTKRFLDITLLAEDMGTEMAAVPADHPDADGFLPRQLPGGQLFDLVLCDGQVLRTHERSSYRERREATRLTATQLALGLQHLRPGGAMILLSHKVEAMRTMKLICEFQSFSTVQLVKPRAGHTKRSSFYMIATKVQSQHPLAVQAVKNWEATWRTATFGSDDDYRKMMHRDEAGVEGLLERFGPQFVEMANDVWATQADALARAPFCSVSS